MRATSMTLVLLVVATLLLCAVGCRQQAGDVTAEAPPVEEHDHEHEATEPETPSPDDTPAAEDRQEAIASTEVDPNRFYGVEELHTLSYIASSGSEAERTKALTILKAIVSTHNNAEVRRSAAAALQGFPNEALPELLQAALEDKDVSVREACLDALSRATPTPELLAGLDRLRSAPDAAVRMAALRTQMGLHLSSGNRAEGLRWVASQLGIRKDDVSAQAMMALHQQGEDVLPACIEVLKTSPSADARAAAACVIGVVCAGTNPSQQEFAKLSKATQKEEVTPQVPPANLTGLEPLQSALANDPSPRVRAMAAQGLGYLGQESSAPLLARALRDTDEEVRWWAATALVTVPPAAAVSDLCAAARDDDSARVRRAAVAGLGWVQSDPEVVAALVDATRDSSSEVRRAAAVQLGRLGAAEALDALAGLLTDADEDVRWAAVVAIGELRNPEAAPLLVGVLRDRNPMVANAAERSLQRMGIAQRRFGTRDEG